MRAGATFSFSEADDDGRVRLALVGELDLVSAPQVAAVIRGHLSAGRPQLVDLGDVTFMDTTGLGAIVLSASDAGERELLTIRPSRHSQPNSLLQLTATSLLFAIDTGADPVGDAEAITAQAAAEAAPGEPTAGSGLL
jgi:anti-anti-sigma factor